MLRLGALLSLLLTASACGSVVEPPPADGNGTGTGSPANPNGGTPSKEEKAEQATTTREVKVTIHNRTSGELLLLKDYQAPLWLEIGSPPYMLNGYGQTWCGGKSYGHNEPAFLSQTIPAGGSISVKWSGLSVSFDDAGSCWRYESVPSSTLSAKACVYEGTATPGPIVRDEKDGNPFPAGPGPHAPPSTWFKTPPTRCIPFTIELKDGGSSVDVEVNP